MLKKIKNLFPSECSALGDGKGNISPGRSAPDRRQRGQYPEWAAFGLNQLFSRANVTLN
jgi:hypothetical protein